MLISYAYSNCHERLSNFFTLGDVDVMLDSGAFSAWTIGQHVDVDGYIAWVKERKDEFRTTEILNLDVIPGRPGNPGMSRERKKAIRCSMENADRIRDAGLPVMEVFHLYDEDFGVLEQLWECRRPGELLAIGGIAGLGTSVTEKRAFGDRVFSHVKELCGGWDKTPPIHGLGVSPDSSLASRYPWWSIDSSAWSIFHRYGREVRSDGSSQNVQGRARTSVRAVSDVYYIRVVKRWRRLEEAYTDLWRKRGVSFID